VESVGHDKGARQLREDGLAVGLAGVDGHDLDGLAVLRGQAAQVAGNGRLAAPVEHLDHPPPVEVGDHRGQLAFAPVVGLIQREPPHVPAGATATSASAVGDRLTCVYAHV
jgi:hypothetical protein